MGGLSSIDDLSLDATLFTGAALAILVVVVLVARQREATRRDLVGIVLLGCYLVVVARAVFLPLHSAAEAARSFDGTAPLHRAWTWGTRLVWPWRAPDATDRLLNMALTVPFGVLVATFWRARPRQVLLVACALAVTIEVVQLTISVAVGYVYRSFDVNDIVDNVAGALLGAGVVALIRSARARARRRALR